MAVDYESMLRMARARLLEEHPRYQEYIDAVTVHLGDLCEDYEIAQTGGWVMVPTWYLKDSTRELCLTYEGECWIVGMYSEDFPEGITQRVSDSLEDIRTAIDSLFKGMGEPNG